MAGNIVKWWRHKILGGYKQFSALNDCHTDSEELIYPIRAPSSCSAPPDLLMSGPDREVLNEIKISKKTKAKRHRSIKKVDHEDRVRLEEFTCDVSLDDEKKPQPLQFSFTLYDLDGHGKITKDDIAGIVSTIYESIGKSVVVPHYGSKTINVRLTVSPDSKTQQSQHKVQQKGHNHRPRSKKLISDNEDTDTSGSVQKLNTNRLSKDCSTTTTTTTTTNSLKEKITKEPLFKNIQMTPHYCKVPQSECCLIAMNSCNETPKGTEYIGCDDCNNKCPFELSSHKLRKKQTRKSRTRKQKNEDSKPRARSLSVGNENCWKEKQEDSWKSPLRRHELIEIIRESMEKNRLCFQANRKPVETPSKFRNRSHTISSQTGENVEKLHHNSPVNSPNHHEANLCGYDSFLHATICSNANNGVHLTASPMLITAPNRLIHQHRNKLRTKQSARHHHSNQMKLSSSLLNQLNPNLTTEQKLNRTINQVEMWLERDQPKSNEVKVMRKIIEHDGKLNNSSHHNNINNRDKMEKVKNDKLQEAVATKKIDNVLNADQRKITENAATSNREISVATKKSNRTDGNSDSIVKEYSNFSVQADAGECENLLKNAASDEEPHVDNTTSSDSTVHRYVLVHHHYHHFDFNQET